MDRGRARVEASARVHFGFQNLSLAHQRLYGGIGASLTAPGVVVEAEPAGTVHAPDPFSEAVAGAVDVLGVEGARVEVLERIPRHVGLGSGTQHALAVYAAVARAHGVEPDPRLVAPALGRGGRSGVGVAAFEAGGVVVDAGHSTARFTTRPPEDGTWSVPPVVARHSAPEDWRLVLVCPSVERGRSGETEEESMREVVERADPDVGDRVAEVLARRLLPALAVGDHESFGAAVSTVSRLNGAWYADEQGGVFRPPVGTVVDVLEDSPAVVGAGQSSWGPTAFGVTHAEVVEQARTAGNRALSAAGVDGDVHVVGVANRGARVELVG